MIKSNDNLGRLKTAPSIIDTDSIKTITATFINLFLENQKVITEYLKDATDVQNIFWLNFLKINRLI
jgi:hypothetical protein